ncbi:hypothetical protein R69746_05626 [Paraburkholderia aspalathi]|uniref:hypothetical protein n=1 Tax=Paraburkholderia aspalathi TaxID=1324617 RepID=UPI00190BB139|nr:hypothetical protein [Paraburkholderia aspalathi]MBK3841750.1 hypothetical protein [Paraburkholderia aspalathi]CAE6811164.1 hypothetical protein R69746_05626 [Paraburkholderia aspalathi]
MKMNSPSAAFAILAAAAFGQFQHAIGRPGRRGKTSHTRRGWSSPHIGAKEQERAKRCYMVDTFPNGTPRSAPVMHQSAKPHPF